MAGPPVLDLVDTKITELHLGHRMRDVSPIEVSSAILKQLVRRMQAQTIDELKSVLAAAWAMIPLITINRLVEGFQARLEFCLGDEGNSISNQLWQISEHRLYWQIGKGTIT
jgi:hypothetical protein